MQQGDDDVDNAQNPPQYPKPGLRPVRRPVRRPVQTDVAEPSAGKVVLLVGVGCLTLVGLLSVIIVMGVSAVWTTVNEHFEEEARREAAETAKFRDFTPFKPGDPMPEPPLDLPRPPPPSSQLGIVDLTEIDGRTLASEAYKLHGQGKYQAAVQCQYQSILKSETGYYNLACFYARAGDIPAALFWLQVSAREEMANPQWALQDDDLIAVRKNPRWPILLNYLTAYQWKWEQSGRSETSLVLPLNATAGQPLPVFIGLHHTNANAHIFIDTAIFQRLADEMGVAFLGVSGTLCRGKECFVWSNDPEKNLARIDAALQEVAEKLTPAEGKLVLFGFSQGGSVAAELAARHPTRFAGAILMSPVADSDDKVIPWQSQSENQKQGIVAVCGAGESPDTIILTNQYAAKFRSSGARVILKIYPGINTPRFPPDFLQRFPIWGKFILDPEAAVPAGGQ